MGRLRGATGAALAAFAVLALAACAQPAKRPENHDEQLADRITRAVMARNTQPVVALFDRRAWSKLHNGRLIDSLALLANEYGALQDLSEQPDRVDPRGVKLFVADFTAGQLDEKMLVEPNGIVRSWQIWIPGSAPPKIVP
ncbi:MAG: hypothetical protein ACREM2_10245 [Vulcanimicrobiaceae bacterium]